MRLRLTDLQSETAEFSATTPDEFASHWKATIDDLDINCPRIQLMIRDRWISPNYPNGNDPRRIDSKDNMRELWLECKKACWFFEDNPKQKAQEIVDLFESQKITQAEATKAYRELERHIEFWGDRSAPFPTLILRLKDGVEAEEFEAPNPAELASSIENAKDGMQDSPILVQVKVGREWISPLEPHNDEPYTLSRGPVRRPKVLWHKCREAWREQVCSD